MSEEANKVTADVRGRIAAAQNDRGKIKPMKLVIAGAIVALLIGVVFALQVLNSHGDENVTLSGAGATFPFPLISKWVQVYENDTSVRVSYEGVGSSGGISRIVDDLVDFAGTDVPLATDKDDLGLLHIPETLGAVVCAYNVPELGNGLNLTGDVIAGIFMLDITNWNDPEIASINPGLTLPDEPITVVRRADGSGTTFIWSSYLSKVNGTWMELYGASKTIDWPTETIGGTGNGGVAGLMSTTPYSIGYLELSYAVENEIDCAAIQNLEGLFVLPSTESTVAAATASAAILPAGDESWNGVEILNAHGDNSYPIASFTYILVYKEQADNQKGKALVDFLWWMVHDGQAYSDNLYYAPLPSEVVELNEETLRSIVCDGEPLYNE
ncbi:MAG: phosphate ABC transporter substrate-binding protein PstS [Candidatus Thermoplasmatota archaeon]|nr:phosphate ABC transporter substrate-binding protein PstS [Candidatus Thermoplasmatota archaeon]